MKQPGFNGVRYDNQFNWHRANPILLDGEIGIVRIHKGLIRVKIGDGKSHWRDLKYMDEYYEMRIICKNDTTNNWNNFNTRLLKGEIGIEFTDDDSIKIKIGDGETRWKDLKYIYPSKDSIKDDINNINSKLKKQNLYNKIGIIFNLFLVDLILGLLLIFG